MRIPRVAAAHDMSGFGRCSLTVALPILSAAGSQCCPLPTALLSTQTSFEGFTFLDTTQEMRGFAAHWKALRLEFEAIYTGFLGSMEQISLLQGFIGAFRRENTLVLVDPVMGDHGKTYKTYTEEMCRGMVELATQADIITPNITEAAILLGLPPETQPQDSAQAIDWALSLSMEGRRSVVVTGVPFAGNEIGAACFDRTEKKTFSAHVELVDTVFHGAGDIFSSALLGALLQGKTLPEAAQIAAAFVRDCVTYSVSLGDDLSNGVSFEPLLHKLGAQVLA